MEGFGRYPQAKGRVVQRAQQWKNILHPGISMNTCPSCIPTFNLKGNYVITPIYVFVLLGLV